MRVGAIEFCEANLPAYGLPLMMNLQGTIDFISIVEGVPRSSVVKSNRTFATGEKVFPGRMQELGVKGGAKLWGHNVAYCTAFVAAAELAKPLHKEFGRQAFLNSARCRTEKMRNVLFAAAALLALAGPTVAGPDIRIETDVPMSVAAKSYPDWNSIPDLSFTCEGVDDPSHHADITVSHQARSIRIDGAEAGPMTKSAAMYNNVRNRFGNYVIVIEVSRVEGPTWMLAEGPNTWWFSDHGRLLYNCLP